MTKPTNPVKTNRLREVIERHLDFHLCFGEDKLIRDQYVNSILSEIQTWIEGENIEIASTDTYEQTKGYFKGINDFKRKKLEELKK